MAYMKVFAVRQRLDKSTKYAVNEEKTILQTEEGPQKEALDYALNSDKTETSLFETALNVETTQTAHAEMQATKEKFSNTGGVLGYHFIQSFKPGEITPEIAHEIGVKFASELFGDKYEVVIGTHLDRAHLHNHIVMNSVSFLDGKKYHSNPKSYYEEIRGTSDRLCREYGLSVIQPKGKGKHYAEQDAEKQGLPTIRQLVRQDIDEILLGCHTVERFWKELKDRGYLVTRKGDNIKHTSIRPKFGKRNIRLDSLGSDYTEEGIMERLYYYRRGLIPPSALEKAKNVTSGENPSGFTTHTPLYYRGKRYRVWLKRRYPKVRGLAALYRHYLFLLGKVRCNKSRPLVNAALRGEVLKFQQYQKQAKLLRYYHIETEAELFLLREGLVSGIESLENARKPLYLAKRKAETPEEKEAVQQEISRLTTELKPLRTQRNLCGKIFETKPIVIENVKFANRVVEEEKELQTDKQRKEKSTHQKR